MGEGKSVLCVAGRHESEKIIEKSRFITYSAHVESEEEARAFLAEIRSKHTMATHCCYAFIADKLGNLQRFSDDGEPQGTAGVPILEVIKNKALYETAVAVVRYFGGIKLGAGGLVRAYSSCAAEHLAGAKICSLEWCTELYITVDYPFVDPLQNFLSFEKAVVLDQEYGGQVRVLVAVKAADEPSFSARLTDRLQGKLRLERGKEYYRAFEV
ncbi:MAG: YigZ family protein [Clostridia bacterium]|nr:YigZ family protein [Clostridia bacterium]